MLKFIISTLSWLLGITFSALIFIAIGIAIHTATIEGLEFGEEFAYRWTRERESYEVEFILEDYTSVAKLADMLEEAGIIDYAWLFRIEQFMMGNSDDYEPGSFLLDTSLSATQINARLRAQPVDLRAEERITIREGWTQRDIAIYLEDRGFFTAEEFMYVANNHDFGFSFLDDLPDRHSRLEGYLFPDTYNVFEDPTPEQVIMTMLVRFNQVFNFDYRMRAQDLGLTIDEVVNIASIIEREVRAPHERPMVARVIYNRLEINMPLQIDATVLYALDRHQAHIWYTDLEVDSPYNTYRITGLPLGPISNPGAASIHAALFPAEGNWLFYVLVNAETGEHFFTNDFAQHQHAQQTYMPRPWEQDNDE